MEYCKYCEGEHEEGAYGNPTIFCIRNLREDLKDFIYATTEAFISHGKEVAELKRQIEDLKGNPHPADGM